MCCCLRLVVQLVVTICLQLVVQSLVSNACDWTSHDWVDQTMSYQLIQMTSFAKHPRLVEYNAEALVWICCSFLLVSCDCWISTQRASAESLARRQNAVVSTYPNDIVLLSLTPTACWSLLEEVPAGFIIARPSAESLARRQNAVVSTYPNDIVLLSLTPSSICCFLLNVMSLLILQLHLLNSNHLLIISSTECDDITDDVIIADSRSCASLLIC
ncbi:hypothetical protein F511_39362 [Dorcoceras hygrometricum]|uniref:Uncharacterized protein n=1 Tax=Dorcoceras hygrometricum TaxID=472368 RepID=A0A2Z7B824_9LAMI|nr:hypothetical protein F511_39362 [Dorcoceras hygrometricum]